MEGVVASDIESLVLPSERKLVKELSGEEGGGSGMNIVKNFVRKVLVGEILIRFLGPLVSDDHESDGNQNKEESNCIGTQYEHGKFKGTVTNYYR